MPDEAFGAGAHTFCASLQNSSPPAQTFSHGCVGVGLAVGAAATAAVGFVVAVVARGAIRAALAKAVLAEAVLETMASAEAISVEEGSLVPAALGDAAAASTVADVAGAFASPLRHMR